MRCGWTRSEHFARSCLLAVCGTGDGVGSDCVVVCLYAKCIVAIGGRGPRPSAWVTKIIH